MASSLSLSLLSFYFLSLFSYGFETILSVRYLLLKERQDGLQALFHFHVLLSLFSFSLSLFLFLTQYNITCEISAFESETSLLASSRGKETSRTADFSRITWVVELL